MSYTMRGEGFPLRFLRFNVILVSSSLPRPPYWIFGDALLDNGSSEAGADLGGSASSLDQMKLLLLLESLERRTAGGGLPLGADREKVQRLSPAMGVALAVAA